MNKIYSSQFVQDTDFFGTFYNYFIVKPLQWSGRVLAVIIDRMIIEKTVIGISVFLLNGAIRLFRNMHYNRAWGGAHSYQIDGHSHQSYDGRPWTGFNELLQSICTTDRHLYRKPLHFPKQEHEDDYFHADRYWYCTGIED